MREGRRERRLEEESGQNRAIRASSGADPASSADQTGISEKRRNNIFHAGASIFRVNKAARKGTNQKLESALQRMQNLGREFWCFSIVLVIRIPTQKTERLSRAKTQKVDQRKRPTIFASSCSSNGSFRLKLFTRTYKEPNEMLR